MERQERLDVVLEEQAGILLLRARGDLDLHGAPVLSSAIRRARRLAGPHGFAVVDMQDVSFVSSAGVAALLEGREQMPGRFAVTRPSDRVRRVFALVGIGDVLPVVDDPGRWAAWAETGDAGPRAHGEDAA